MISWEPLNEQVEDIYYDDGKHIIPKHNFLTGSRNYVLATLEQLIGQLERTEKNDSMIIFLSSSILNLIKNGDSEYYRVIEEVGESTGAYDDFGEIIANIERKFSKNILNNSEKQVLDELIPMNLSEYSFKSDYEKCDYQAMKIITTLTYKLLLDGIKRNVSEIEIYVDTDSKLISWNLSYGSSNVIWLEWIALDKIDHYLTIYEVHCSGLKKSSMLELASADMIEEEYTKKERREISYSLLVKQYCGVIEQEINEIIQLKNTNNKPAKNLMWKDLKEYVRKNGIELVAGDFALTDLLYDLHQIRNLASHGEPINREQYTILKKYKDKQLFEFISWTKLDLMEIRIEPTVEQMCCKR
jgi:hypothetical protein